MLGRVFVFFVSFLAFGVQGAPSSNSTFSFSPIQFQLAVAFDQQVASVQEHSPSFHYFKKLRVELNSNTSVAEAIGIRETSQRRDYVMKPIEIVQLSQGWKATLSNRLFIFEWPKTHGDTGVPFFCQRWKMSSGSPPINRFQCQQKLNQFLNLLPSNLESLSCYLVVFEGNKEGNFRYVKLYIGRHEKKTSRQFLVIDWVVYENPYK